MKKLALFDIDGVIYDGHIIFDSVQDQEEKRLIAKGTWNQFLKILDNYKLGKSSYKYAADKMLAVYARALAGQGYQDLIIYTRKFIQEYKSRFFPYFAEVVPVLSVTHDIYLVTTNFDFASSAVADFFGLKGYLSSTIDRKNGIVLGKVSLSLGGNKGIVENLIKEYGKEGSIAVGDSENDADMLEKVEFPLVMEPDQKLSEISRTKDWQIVNRDTIADIIEAHTKQNEK